jgi:hypothetical protein
MENIFEEVCDLKLDKSEKEIESICISLENNKDFQKLFFYIEKDYHRYYYHSSKEDRIKKILFNSLDVGSLSEYIFVDYGEELIENCNPDENIKLGSVLVSEEDFYESLSEEFLREDDYIDRLVNAPNFKEELAKIKKECLEYLFVVIIDEAKEALEQYVFED